MSSELPAGAMSLEPDEDTAIVGAVADPTVPLVDADDADPEGTITIPSGKVVPVGAVQAERGRRKEAEKALTAKDAEIATLKAKADKYDQVEPQIRAAMPIIEGIQRRPDLVAQLNQPAPVAKEAAGPLTADEAVEYAKDFDLFTPEGKPDVDRAQRIAKRHETMNARSTANAIAPFAQNEAQRQSQTLYRQVASYKDAQGNTVDATILKNIWNLIPAEQSSKPEVAGVLYRMALAEQMIQGKGPKPGLPPVVQTEGVGQRTTQNTTITGIDTQMMKAAGIAEKDYTATASRFKPGQSNSLE